MGSDVLIGILRVGCDINAATVGEGAQVHVGKQAVQRVEHDHVVVVQLIAVVSQDRLLWYQFADIAAVGEVHQHAQVQPRVTLAVAVAHRGHDLVHLHVAIQVGAEAVKSLLVWEFHKRAESHGGGVLENVDSGGLHLDGVGTQAV